MMSYLTSLNISIYFSTFIGIFLFFLSFKLIGKNYLFFTTLFLSFFSYLIYIVFYNTSIQFFSGSYFFMLISLSLFYSLIFIFISWFSFYLDTSIKNLFSVAMCFFGVRFFQNSIYLASQRSIIVSSIEVLELRLGKDLLGGNISNLISLEGINLSNIIYPFFSIFENITEFFLFFCFLLFIFILMYRISYLKDKNTFLKYSLITFLSAGFFFLYNYLIAINFIVFLFILSIPLILILLNFFYSKKSLTIFKDFFGDLNDR